MNAQRENAQSRTHRILCDGSLGFGHLLVNGTWTLVITKPRIQRFSLHSEKTIDKIPIGRVRRSDMAASSRQCLRPLHIVCVAPLYPLGRVCAPFHWTPKALAGLGGERLGEIALLKLVEPLWASVCMLGT
jgi:hypothetical protein